MQTTAFLGVAHIHTPSFIKRIKERDGVQVKAVYDHQPERAQKCADELGATVSSVEEILADPEITSVIICSETARHLELVLKAAEAGKHLFVEKPLAIAADEAEQMRAAIKKAGVVFQTGFFMRSSPTSQFLKREVEAGNLGPITRMRHTNGHQGALAGWFDTDWHWIVEKDQAGGGGLADLGAHSLDIILNVLRPTCGPVVKALGVTGTQTRKYGDEIDEYGAGLLLFESGAIAEVEGSWVDPKLRAAVEVFGTEGQIQVQGNKVFYFSSKVEGADGGEVTDLPAAGPHAFELFWDKLEGKDLAVPLVTVDEAAEESRVMAELYRSAEG